MTDHATSPVTTRLDGEAVEVGVSRDIIKRGVWVAPALVAIAFLIWGTDGAASAGFAIGLVLVNFALSAMLLAYTAKISLGLMMGAALFGYLLRLGLIMGAVLLVRDTNWISLPALGATIIVTHLGLLIWELRYVAISLAFPGLKPTTATTRH